MEGRQNRRLRERKAMALKLKKGIKELLAEANAEIQTLTPAEALALKDDPNLTLVDLRDIRELERDGRVPGAFHAPRGMLEFWVDPESPYHKEIFASGKRFVFFCAGGLRSALAAQTVQRMGLAPVAHIEGGFKAWKEAGGPVDEPKPDERTSRSAKRA
jgi:rhodanese-related sulfurtransferase